MKIDPNNFKISKKHVKKGAEVSARAAGGLIHLILKILITVILVGILTALIFAIIFGSYVKNSLDDELNVNLSDFALAQTSVVYYWDDTSSSWEVLEELSGREKRKWVSYEDIPRYFIDAAVAIEDKRFWSHQGVDWYRTVGAFGSMFLSMSNTFGGSTITQQLIKNLTEYDEVTVKRKLLEIFRALDFEKTYSKEEIMEWYLNKIYLGEGCYGIAAAADEYFGKTPDQLTVAECASIIGITNNPSLYDPYINEEGNKNRQRVILGEMYDQEYITAEEYEEALAQELDFHRGSDDETDTDSSDYTSWFVDALIEDVISDLMVHKNVNRETASDLLYSAGYKIYATIDTDVQDCVDEIYSDRSNLPSGYKQSTYQQLESAIVIVDPYTGNVVALAGGMGEKEGSRLFNYATDMHRSPGSTIKPLASYSLAMDMGLITPYTTMYDSAAAKLNGTDWLPNNDNEKNEGHITIRYALQRSINTVAAQLVDMLSPTTSYNFLTQKLGFKSLVGDGGTYTDISYAPMALGELSDGATVREMASAYTCFANDGIWTESRLYTHITDSQDNLIYDNVPDSNIALSSNTAYYMTDLMQNVVNAGSGFYAKFGDMPVAGKTGGSSGWRDRWFVGYTPYYVGAVWCGYEIPEGMGSSNPSTTMWKLVMEKVHEDLPTKQFNIPENMRQVTICIDSGMRATENCTKEVRGNRTMTLYMDSSAIPAEPCNCHVMVELCSDSMSFNCGSCPMDKVETFVVLDVSKCPNPVTVYPYYSDTTCYEEEDPTLVEDKLVPYTLDNLDTCHMHNIDSATGWYRNSETGFLVNPQSGLIYDPVNDKIYDKYSGWEIEWKTGALIDPLTGELIDPWTGKTYVPDGTITADSPDKFQRPPGYGPGGTFTEVAPPVDDNTGDEPIQDPTPTPDSGIGVGSPGDIAVPPSEGGLFYGGF